jgi:hypothetical protein
VTEESAEESADESAGEIDGSGTDPPQHRRRGARLAPWWKRLRTVLVLVEIGAAARPNVALAAAAWATIVLGDAVLDRGR